MILRILFVVSHRICCLQIKECQDLHPLGSSSMVFYTQNHSEEDRASVNGGVTQERGGQERREHPSLSPETTEKEKDTSVVGITYSHDGNPGVKWK